jgi:hypothetical protein
MIGMLPKVGAYNGQAGLIESSCCLSKDVLCV